MRASPIFGTPCACGWASGSGGGSISSGGGGGGGSSLGSWNFSLECLQGKNLAECNFGVEIRNLRSNSFVSSRRRGSTRDALTINGTGKISKYESQGQSFKDVHLQLLNKVREFQTLALQGATQWKIFPPSRTTAINLTLGVLALVFLTGMIKLRELVSRGRGRDIKSRILRSDWYKDNRSPNGKRKLDKSAFWPVKNSKSEDGDVSVFERLVIHDGEVVTGGSNSKLEQQRRRKIAVPPRSDAERIRNSTLAKANRHSRIRSFLSRLHDQKRKSVSRNSIQSSPEDSISASASSEKQTSEARPYRDWTDHDEDQFRKRIENLRQTVQAAESKRRAAIQALAEERKRSLELEIKIRRQKEAAIALEEEVRVLKESHEALLTSLRKKYSSSAAARAAAALLYQNWESGETSGV